LPHMKENYGVPCYNIRVIKILIYEARTKEGLSLRKLSELTGISKTRLNDIENEKRSPTLNELERIANILDVKVESLYKIKSSL
jgi:transcriptional regulator with XRE-family HTH domain